MFGGNIGHFNFVNSRYSHPLEFKAQVAMHVVRVYFLCFKTTGILSLLSYRLNVEVEENSFLRKNHRRGMECDVIT